jgi:hypothetical protein
MPTNLKIINTKDFIKTTVTGELDLDASKQALGAVVSLMKQPGEYDVLLDTRKAESLLTPADRYHLGEGLAMNPILRRSRICLLVEPKDMDGAGFFETVVVNRGVNARAFANFEQAITWLVVGASKQV